MWQLQPMQAIQCSRACQLLGAAPQHTQTHPNTPQGDSRLRRCTCASCSSTSCSSCSLATAGDRSMRQQPLKQPVLLSYHGGRHAR